MQKDSNLLRKLAEGRYNGRCNGESEVRYALTISEKKYFNGAISVFLPEVYVVCFVRGEQRTHSSASHISVNIYYFLSNK